jgi:hypothetical protein
MGIRTALRMCRMNGLSRRMQFLKLNKNSFFKKKKGSVSSNTRWINFEWSANVKLMILIFSSMLFLISCGHDPTAPPTVLNQCPEIPNMELTNPDVLEMSFTNRMQNFLSGKLSEPINLDYPSSGAKPLMIPLDPNNKI